MSLLHTTRRTFLKAVAPSAGGTLLAPRGVLSRSMASGAGATIPQHATSGVMKDVVMVGGYQEGEIDFVANNPGLTLFHCHQQLHMDFGFMTLFDYV
jgi:FtsP/CotA-like multicopper oxidase with cupredoxin domain